MGNNNSLQKHDDKFNESVNSLINKLNKHQGDESTRLMEKLNIGKMDEGKAKITVNEIGEIDTFTQMNIDTKDIEKPDIKNLNKDGFDNIIDNLDNLNKSEEKEEKEEN
jgi:tRNA A37 threonylcarbamoyladenosine dehydratase